MSNMRSLIIGTIVIIILIVGAIVLIRFLRSGKNTTKTTTGIVKENVTPVSGFTSSTVTLNTLNGSKELGIAQVEELSGQIRVSLNLQKYTPDTLQPSNIYMGTCDTPGSVLYQLAPTFNGKSVTTLETTKERLSNQKPLIIGVTKSQKDTKLAACGAL